MKIIDLNDQHLPLYLLCLEDWSDEIREAGCQKEIWYRRMKDLGLRVKLALDDNGNVGGMIQYVPIQHSVVRGDSLYFINCIWVHGHKQGRGNFQGRGMGSALLSAAEEDARALGAKGIAAWGIILPFWMRASWFKKNGYRIADRDGIRVLLWKPFSADIAPPSWIRRKTIPPVEPNKVTVTAFCNGWCPAQNLVLERAKRAAQDPAFGNAIIFRQIDTFPRDEFLRWGISDAVYVNGKEVRSGPPPSYDKIRRIIAKSVRKIAS